MATEYRVYKVNKKWRMTRSLIKVDDEAHLLAEYINGTWRVGNPKFCSDIESMEQRFKGWKCEVVTEEEAAMIAFGGG